MNDDTPLDIVAIITRRVEVRRRLAVLLHKHKNKATVEKIRDFILNEDARFNDQLRVILDRVGATRR